MFVLSFSVLTFTTVTAFYDDQFRNRFRFHGWMMFFLIPLVLVMTAQTFFDSALIIRGLPVKNLVIVSIFVTICLFNIKESGIIIVTIGTIFNALARLVNGGYIPVSPEAWIQYNGNLADLPTKGVFVTEITRLPLLVDWLYFPYAGCIFSSGDVLLGLGFLIITIQYLKFKYKPTRL